MFLSNTGASKPGAKIKNLIKLGANKTWCLAPIEMEMIDFIRYS
jgi:hypothetical protein